MSSLAVSLCHPIILLFCIFILSREQKYKHNAVLSSSPNQLTACFLFACRVIPSDPAQVAEEVGFGGCRASGQWAEGGVWDDGGSGQTGRQHGSP